MPFYSDKQRKWMWVHMPETAHKWAHETEHEPRKKAKVKEKEHKELEKAA